MSDAISRKEVLKFLRSLYEVNQLSQAGKALDYVIQKLESGRFDIPSPSEGEAEGWDRTQSIELALLKMWANAGIEEVYKYKYRIKAYRNPLTNIDLLYDTSGRMFTEVEDIASTRDSEPEDSKVSIAELIRKREALSPIGEQKEDTGPSKSTLGLMTKEDKEQ